VGEVSGSDGAGIFIAVDGGGTKTDAVALDIDGTVVARVRGAGSAYDPERTEASVRTVDQVITDVHRAADSRTLLGTSIYLSGLDTEAEIDSFRTAISTTGWARSTPSHRLVVENDMFALLRSGTESENAVAVVCGTGINCVGVRADGRHARFFAWGMVSGDWGGGWGLGEQAIWHAARALDGRGPWTSLVSSIPEVLGEVDLVSTIEGVHFGRIPVERYSLLAPSVLEAALAGDAAAVAIVSRQATEIVDFAVAAIRRLDLEDEPVPVVLGGGVIASGNAFLLDRIRSELGQKAPRAHVTIVHSRPILGAALLTLESAGASPSALDRARAQLERRSFVGAESAPGESSPLMSGL
jgi:N-acetylglucosamine kinase-like BadF-type ATPase